MLLTSLNEIKSFSPCSSGWKDVLKGQNKSQPDAVEFSLADCLDSNSIRDVLWLIGKRKQEIQIAVDFAKWCADSIKHLKRAAAYAAYAAYAADAADAAAADAAAAAADAAAYAAYAAAADADAAYAAAADADAAYAAAAKTKVISQQKEKLKELILNYA